MWRRGLAVAGMAIVVAFLGWWVVSTGRMSDEERSAASTFGQFVLAAVGIPIVLVQAVIWVWRSTARSATSPQTGQDAPEQAPPSVVSAPRPVAAASPEKSAAQPVDRVDMPPPRRIASAETAKPVVFHQRRRYAILRWWLIAAIVAAAVGLIQLVENPHVTNQISPTASAAIVGPALLLGFAVTTVIPRTYALTIDRSGIELANGRDSTSFRYQWTNMTEIGLVPREDGILKLEVYLASPVDTPRPTRLRPGARPSNTSDSFTLDVTRFDKSPADVEHALETFAGPAWSPCREAAAASPNEQPIPNRTTFTTRRFILAFLAVVLLLGGLSPLLGLLNSPPWWRASLLVLWTLMLCAPGALVMLCVARPAELVVDDHGLRCRRNGQTWPWSWADIERVAILGASRSGLAPRFVFVRAASGPAADLPWRRLSARMNGVVVCDLFSLNATKSQMGEALAQFGGDRFDPDYHPDHGLRSGAETTVDGRIASPRTFLAVLAVFAASVALMMTLKVIGPAVVASEIAIAVGVWLTALLVTTRCQLSMDTRGITFNTGRRRPQQIVWTDLRSVHLLRILHVAKRQPTTVTRLVITPKRKLRLPGSWLLQDRVQSDYQVLCDVDSLVCQLNASVAVIDAELKRFAGDRYRDPVTQRRPVQR